MKKTLRFLKTTALGGLVFLLPLVVLGILIGQVVQIVRLVVGMLHGVVPVDVIPGGITVLILLGIAAVVLLCFVAGMIARGRLGRRIRDAMEKKLMLLFPRYGIYKEQLAGNLGDDVADSVLKPVLVRFDDQSRVGFETHRSDGGHVTIYLPGSPDPWVGGVVIVTPDRVEPLDAEFTEVIHACETLGRENAELLDG